MHESNNDNRYVLKVTRHPPPPHHFHHSQRFHYFPFRHPAPFLRNRILILAAAVFYVPGADNEGTASLPDAFQLIKNVVGKGAAILFALALLCAGQSASITATVAGQVVCEGFIRMKVSVSFGFLLQFLCPPPPFPILFNIY